ncbi:MAG: hypothetical protein ACXVZX_00660 [Terriglobales bacterium]
MQDAGDVLEMFAVGAIVGAGLMYLMDPKLGRARRNYLRDQAIHGINVGRRETSRFLRDKRNRARGVIAESFRGNQWLGRARDAASNIGQQVSQRAATWP